MTYGMPTVLTIHVDSVDAISAMLVSHDGVHGEGFDWAPQKVEFAGHVRDELSLKSDEKESVIALKRAVAARRNARTTLVESQVRVSYESECSEGGRQVARAGLEVQVASGGQDRQAHPAGPPHGLACGVGFGGHPQV